MAIDIAIARPELLQVADAVAREKMIERDEVLEAMEQAIQKAGRAKYGAEKDIRATIDRKTGEVLQIGALAGERPDFHAGLHQRACHGPADKSCRSGNEGFHDEELMANGRWPMAERETVRLSAISYQLLALQFFRAVM